VYDRKWRGTIYIMHQADEVYTKYVASLPPPEQVRLVAFIFNGLAATGSPNYCDEWSEEDIRDFTAFSMAHEANDE
jgi:hypothetical protein